MPLELTTKGRLLQKRHRLNQLVEQIFEVKGKLYEIWLRWHSDECDYETYIVGDRSPLHALYYEADQLTSNPIMREFKDLKIPR